MLQTFDPNTVRETLFDYDKSGSLSTITVLWVNDVPQLISSASKLHIFVFVSELELVQGCLISPITNSLSSNLLL